MTDELIDEREGKIFLIGLTLGLLIVAFATTVALLGDIRGDVMEVGDRHFVNVELDWYEYDPTEPIEFTKVATP